MGRPKKEVEPEIASFGSTLKELKKEIETKYKAKGLIGNATDIVDRKPDIISLSPALDDILAGGLPEGSWVSVSGRPKLGKSSTLLTAAANAQRPEHGSRLVVYADAEHRLKQKNLVGIKGLDFSPDRFIHLRSTQDKILSAKDFLDIVLMYLKSIPKIFVIFDSVSALVSANVLDGGMGTSEMMSGSRLVSQFCDIAQSIVPLQNSIVCGVTHIIASPKSPTGTSEKAANRWIYQADVRLKATHSTPWCVGGKKNPDTGYTEGGTQIGQIVHWACQESAIGAPGGKCESYLRYGIGIDRLYELFEMGKAANLIAQNGAWYSLAFLNNRKDLHDEDEVPKAQGGEAIFKLLEARPDWCEALNDSVMAFLRPAA